MSQNEIKTKQQLYGTDLSEYDEDDNKKRYSGMIIYQTEYNEDTFKQSKVFYQKNKHFIYNVYNGEEVAD